MSLAKRVVSKPTTILIIYLIILGMGLYTVFQTPIDLFPDIKFPMLVIYTEYEGAGPEQVEKMVSRPLEGAFSNVTNLEKITSRSSKGQSLIMLEFGWGVDLGEAANEVRDKLEWVKEYLPDEATSPQIYKMDPSMMPIMELSLEGTRPLSEMNSLAENRVVPVLEQVPGVSMVSIYGGREKVIKVEIPQNRLDAYGLSLTQVGQMLAAQNIQLGSGNVYEGNRTFLVQTTGEYSSIEDIKNTVISYKGGAVSPTGVYDPTKVILLRDIANVFEGYKDVESSVYINGNIGLDISVQKQSGVNSVQTANNIYEKLEEIEANLPPDVNLRVIYDTTDMIRNSLKQVGMSALIGAILAMAILFLFLRNFRSTIIIGLSIPISLIVTLMVMYFMNLTLNLMTLAGLTLGIGMIVDSSIVILENIFRYREKGAKLKPSAILGSQEMITAIMASTLTTVCIFVPIILFKKQLEIAGVLFQDLAITVVISLVTSLVIAMTLVPVLSSKYIKLYTRKQRPMREGFLKTIDSAMEKFFTNLDNLYKRILSVLLVNKGKTVAILVLLFVASVSSAFFLGFKLFPDGGQPFVQLQVELPVGTRIEVTEDVLQQVVNIIEEDIEAYDQIITVSGQSADWFSANNTNQGTVTISLPDFEDRVENDIQVMDKLRQHFEDFPGVQFSFASGFNSLSNSNPIDIILKSEDMDLAIAKGNEIVEILEEHCPELTEPYLDVEDALPLVEVVIDREKAYALGLNVLTIGQEISASIDGTRATVFRYEGDEYDVILELPEEDRNSIPDLNNIFVMNSMGQRIPVSSFASLEKESGPVTINREDRIRAVHVKAGLAPKVPLNEGEMSMRGAIGEHYVSDDSVIVEYAGDFKDLMKYMLRLVGVMVLAIALVFGVMASQFESFRDPMIVFLSMPFLIVGIVALYFITGTNISMFTAVGLIMLIGIVVNNGIVLVDYTNLLRARGLKLHEACIEAGGNRLRPVLMTSLTTILGMAPMAFNKGEGTDMVQPIGQSIVGGMIVSTLFTLMIVPVLYAYFNRARTPRKLKKKLLDRFTDGKYEMVKEDLLAYYDEKKKCFKRKKGMGDEEREVLMEFLKNIGLYDVFRAANIGLLPFKSIIYNRILYGFDFETRLKTLNEQQGAVNG